jgi:putative transposase
VNALSWKERKELRAELRRIYTAADADAAREVLDELSAAWANSKTRTAALAVWDRAWERVIPFLAFPEEIRRIIYTTNSVESLHMQIRKTIKTRGHFPNDDAALRLIWLAIMRAKTTWRTCYNWTQAMAVLRIHFGDRIPDNT